MKAKLSPTSAPRKKKGFTLAELLIVVAIIAVLVAIAIPTFTSSLNKAKHAVDLSNVRAAYSEGVVTYLQTADTTSTKINVADLKTKAGVTSDDSEVKLDSNKISVESYGITSTFPVDPTLFTTTEP